MAKKRILFSGYAPVHFICYLPIYQKLRQDPDIELFLSGGFRTKTKEVETFSIDGFYDDFPVDRSGIMSVQQTKKEDFDVFVCAHTGATLFPRHTGHSVEIFHGVSFKNLSIREKVLQFDTLCIAGRYHAERFEQQGLVRPGTRYLLTGFPKADKLVSPDFDRLELFKKLELDPDKPTVLFAPTGEKGNALDVWGKDVIRALAGEEQWNLLVKPHDHPKKESDWFKKLAKFESHRMKLVHDRDITGTLRIADLLVTDASSVAVEFTLLDKPLLFMDVPGLIDRIKRRAPAIDLETYGRKIGTTVNSPDKLTAAIADSLAHPDREGEIRRKMAKHLFHKPGGSVDRVVGVVRHAAGLDAELPPSIEIIEPRPVV